MEWPLSPRSPSWGQQQQQHASHSHESTSTVEIDPIISSDQPENIAPTIAVQPIPPPHLITPIDPTDSTGQDHDKMQTDEESDADDTDSDSELDTSEPSESTTTEPLSSSYPPRASTRAETEGQAAAEAMDTTPDQTPAPESLQASRDATQSLEVSGHSVSQSSTTLHVNITANIGTDAQGVTTILGSPSLSFNMNTLPQTTGEIHAHFRDMPANSPSTHDLNTPLRVSDQSLASIRNSGFTPLLPPPIPSTTTQSAARRIRRTEDSMLNDPSTVDDASDDDESSDDEEHPYWASFKADLSKPDEVEQKVLDQACSESSATDHEHWEKLTFEALEDPEYIPITTGRIQWTAQGVHGTPEKPNRERVMRSPPVRIGDFYWNIKFYPRGNDGTEQASVYLECSPTLLDESHTLDDILAPRSIIATNTNDQPEDSKAMGGSIHANPKSGKDGDARTSSPWHVSAQISCVMYNPKEPRVHAMQQSCHRYYNDNSDWGWTRFHGPWDELHTRKRYQRCPILQDDTLSFTAYIRTVKDETNALWWHPSKSKPGWNSLEMTNLYGFHCQWSNIIAALSSWLHLKPFLDLINHAETNSHSMEYGLLLALSTSLRGIDCRAEEQSISLEEEKNILEQFQSQGGIGNLDVIAIWEILRRLCNHEFANTATIEKANDSQHDRFSELLVLRQPDPFACQPLGRSVNDFQVVDSKMVEPASVQAVLDVAASDPKRVLRVWESYQGQNQTVQRQPSVVHIELHRQHFNRDKRRWKKLGHRIAMNDKITFNGIEYVHYGHIVHCGSLESREYYSVLRPGGPGTRWVKYVGSSSSRKVTILTTKQAVWAHEGRGHIDTDNDEQSSEKTGGNSAVAYVVMYVRADRVKDILQLPLEPATMKRRDQDARAVLEACSGPALTPISFYGGDVFIGHEGPALFDTKSSRVLEDCKQCFYINLPVETRIEQLRRLLDVEATKLKQTCDGYTSGVSLFQVSEPMRLVRGSLESCQMDNMCTVPNLGFAGFDQFWIASDKDDFTNQLFERLKTIDITAALAALPWVASEANVDEKARTQDETEMTDVLQQNEGTSDTIMSDAQPPAIPEAVSSATNVNAISGAPTSPEGTAPECFLCFLKAYDWQDQSIRGFRSFVVRKATVDKAAGEVAIKLIKMLEGYPTNQASTHKIQKDGDVMQEDDASVARQPEEQDPVEGQWEIHQEVGCSARPLPEDATFWDCRRTVREIISDDPLRNESGDDLCFIAQRRLSPAQKESLISAGLPSSAPELLHYLNCIADNPGLAAPHRTTSYFGSSYFSGSQVYGKPHGLGFSIDLNGDVYTGPFRSGVKHGPAAEYLYANGDKYTGSFAADLPDGQGTMLYAKTGNTYTGGWKGGKRHGKGVMTYNVADEEERLCQVCYEAEMDALFYACGHVCACEACARRVDHCMVCRERVRGVVKVRWTV